MSMLPIKTYIDARLKSSDPTHNTDFNIDLLVNATLPDQTACVVQQTYTFLYNCLIETTTHNNIATHIHNNYNDI